MVEPHPCHTRATRASAILRAAYRFRCLHPPERLKRGFGPVLTQRRPVVEIMANGGFSEKLRFPDDCRARRRMGDNREPLNLATICRRPAGVRIVCAIRGTTQPRLQRQRDNLSLAHTVVFRIAFEALAQRTVQRRLDFFGDAEISFAASPAVFSSEHLGSDVVAGERVHRIALLHESATVNHSRTMPSGGTTSPLVHLGSASPASGGSAPPASGGSAPPVHLGSAPPVHLGSAPPASALPNSRRFFPVVIRRRI